MENLPEDLFDSKRKKKLREKYTGKHKSCLNFFQILFIHIFCLLDYPRLNESREKGIEMVKSNFVHYYEMFYQRYSDLGQKKRNSKFPKSTLSDLMIYCGVPVFDKAKKFRVSLYKMKERVIYELIEKFNEDLIKLDCDFPLIIFDLGTIYFHPLSKHKAYYQIEVKKKHQEFDDACGQSFDQVNSQVANNYFDYDDNGRSPNKEIQDVSFCLQNPDYHLKLNSHYEMLEQEEVPYNWPELCSNLPEKKDLSEISKLENRNNLLNALDYPISLNRDDIHPSRKPDIFCQNSVNLGYYPHWK